MRLLVSVSAAAEAVDALAGGADLIDAKDPLAGPLGAVSIDVLQQIRAVVGNARPVTAALGDAADEAEVERHAREFAAAGVAFVKVGFAGVTSAARAAALASAAVRGASEAGPGRSGVVVVGYGDGGRVGALPVAAVVDVAARAGAVGVLLDTADKAGPGLRRLVAPNELARWVADAHDAGLLVALAGKLTADDLGFAREMGADIAGVRGAACDGGRSGRVSAEKVRLLRALCDINARGHVDVSSVER